MSTSMNSLRAFVAVIVALALLMGMAMAAPGEAEIVIDVVEGRLRAGAHDIPLADDVERPIQVGIVDGDILVRIQTPDGALEENWGSGFPSLTERAVSYATVLEEPVKPKMDLDAYEQCPICDRSTGIGYHKQLPCGHWGCLHSVDHFRVCDACEQYVCNGISHMRCDHCKVHMCVHVDIECEYTRNPAPTPYTTKDPDGKSVYYTIDPSGTSAQGAPGGQKPKDWSPGTEYVKTPPPEGLEGMQLP